MRGTAPLPGVLAEIAEIAGRDTALEIAMAHGGERLHIPRPAFVLGARGETHPLTLLLGREVAGRIAGRLGGNSIYIPMARRALVRHLAGQGVPTAAIAERLGLTRDTARRYRN